MNKIVLMGRIARDPEIRYSQGTSPIAVAKYSLAVNRKFKKEGEPDADFINCVAFGKLGEFAEKYLKKGIMIAVCGSLRINSWVDKDTEQKRFGFEVVVDEQNFAESKSSFESRQKSEQTTQSDYYTSEPVNEADLPF